MPTPDAYARLSRAINILLRFAARDAAQSQEKLDAEKHMPPRQAPAEEVPPGGSKEGSSSRG